MGHNGCDGSQASGPWAIGSGYRFNISIFSSLFFYIGFCIFHYCLRACRESALQSASRGRQIRDVTVSIDYRVYETHGFVV